jgi:hypothetical protein
MKNNHKSNILNGHFHGRSKGMKHETRYNEDKKIKPHFLLQSE